jgi:hypothetical protein
MGNKMAKTLKEILESFDFNRAAIAKQRLQNLRHSGRRVRGSSVANLMRAAGLREEEMDEEDLDQLDEVLSTDASSEDYIKDFVHSTDPRFEGKTKKERIKMALGAYYGKQRSKDGEGLGEEVELEEAQYAGLEKEDKPGKVKTAVVKTHPKAVDVETVEGWKDEKKPVKEEYDEEGNLITMSKTFKEFMLEYTPGPGGVTRHVGTYGTAKGAKYGNTDYDKETLDTKDDESGEQVKRGRGRPAGSKSGARGPRIK